MWRRILINSLVVLLIVVLGFYVAFCISFYTPIVSQKLIRSVITEEFPQYKIEKLKIGRQTFFFPRQLTFYDIDLKLRQGKDEFQFNVVEVSFDHILAFIKKEVALQIQIRQAQAHWNEITLQNIQIECLIELTRASQYQLKGTGTAQSLEFSFEKLQDLDFEFSGDQNQFRITNGFAKAYNGTLKGDLVLDVKSENKYTVNLLLNEIDFTELKKINDAYAGLEGKLSGSVQLSGKNQKAESISLNLAITGGGRIKSDLLKFLVEYVPTINLDKEKKKLFEEPSMIPFEKGTIQLKNLNDKQLSGLIVLESRKLNMNFNLEPTINIEGGFFRSLEALLTYSGNQQRR